MHKRVIHNHFHNILRRFDVLPNFPFTTSEMMRDYYLQTWYIRVGNNDIYELDMYEHMSQEIRKHQQSLKTP